MYWKQENYGKMAESLVWISEKTFGKKAGETRNDFESFKIKEFSLLSVEGLAPAKSDVAASVTYDFDGSSQTKEVCVGAVYEDENGNSKVFPSSEGYWKIIQATLSKILYER